ncbi:hypothetical protein O181_016273 [Austropuccinia psidii MF-1]|uniref:CCHC-type domain-containing protein n=1 Tax=Austropuccinia psidii MF-1 TaxID=1389203 RepID=A0A9Q3GQQ0_9BASI|nr:hypothetical protein [Austropuccinia psidii MF-1]
MTQDSARYSTRSQTKLQENPARNTTNTKNLPELTRDVDMLIDKGVNPLYLQSGYVGDEKHERFCRAVLLSLVPDSIQDSIITICPCHAIYTWLKHHYFATTRSSQCVAFNKLLSIEIRDNESPSSLIMRMNEALTDFKNRSGNLGDNYRPKTSDIQLSFNSITVTPRTNSHKSKGHTAMRTTMQLTCHTCNKCGHMARNCPALLGQRTNTAAPMNHAFKPVVAPPRYHAHYPIITPPVHPPFNSFHPPYASKATPQPNLYRPCYQQHPIASVKACIVEIGNPNEAETGISMEDVANPGDRQSVYDTGASHSRTLPF